MNVEVEATRIAGDARKHGIAPWLCLALIVGAHAVALIGLFGTEALRGVVPVTQLDYGLHYYRAVALRESGGFPGLVWDPSYMAGYALGGSTDIDNRLGELAVWALFFLEPVTAWNWTLFVLFLLVPLLLFFAGRQAELAPPSACLAAFLGSVLFWLALRKGEHAYPFIGMYGWVMVLAVLPLFVTSFQSLLQHPTLRRAGLLAFVTAFAALANALSVLYVPLLIGILLSRLPHMGRRHWLAVVGSVIGAFVLIMPFLLPVLESLPGAALTQELTAYYRASKGKLVLWLGDPRRGLEHGLLLLGVAGLALGWLDRKNTELVLCALIVTTVSLFAFLIPGFADMQPTRHLEAGVFLVCLPAARVVERFAAELEGLRLPVRALIAALAVVLLLPGMTLWLQAARGKEPLGTRPSKDAQALVAYLDDHTTPNARILIEDDNLVGGAYGDPRLLGYLAHEISRELIGGPHAATWCPVGDVTFANGDLFRRPIQEFADEELNSILKAYNIGTVVCFTTASIDRFRSHGLALARRIGPFAVFTHEAPGFAVGGPRARARASFNRIVVTDATESPTRLRWNFDARWRTEPPLPLRAVEAPFNPVGFIEVENGNTTDFVLRFDG